MSGDKLPSNLAEAVIALCYAYRANLALGYSQLPFDALLEAYKQDLAMTGTTEAAYLAACEQLEAVVENAKAKTVSTNKLVRPPSPSSSMRRPKH